MGLRKIEREWRTSSGWRGQMWSIGATILLVAIASGLYALLLVLLGRPVS